MFNNYQERGWHADTLPAYLTLTTQHGRSIIVVKTIAFMLASIAVSASATIRTLIAYQDPLPLQLINSTVIVTFSVISLLGTRLAELDRDASPMSDTVVHDSSRLPLAVAAVKKQDVGTRS